ncbi:MAG: hypothetical protein IH931_08590 [candidate division Zixibacteria bacterium]|nr:hypothetical protein [candidate division Zixibacteria bacterium]
MRIRQLMFGVLFIFCFSAAAQSENAQSDSTDRPCSAPEAGHFDFWVGSWELTWNDTVKGTNVITKELDSCVIHEDFSHPTENFYGQSYSVYNPTISVWQQTWVDNSGNYLDFEGGFKKGKMTLNRTFVGPKGKTVMQRMMFYNIADDSLDWSWESSLDDGKTWKQNWLIHYERASENLSN